MELTRQNIRTFSMLGQRGAIFGMAALDAAASDKDFILLTADLATLSGMERYIRTYPDRFVNVGIAEQNMLGIAAGLAAEGFHPVATTYATFLTMRGCEQIRHYFGYMGLRAVLIGSGAGLCQAFAGNTHYTIEDISMMRAIPGITIFSPADAGAAVKLFHTARELESACYIHLTGNLNCPVVYKEDTDFQPGGSKELTKGNDVVIYATGTMVASALKAAALLPDSGITATVVDMYSLKPVDRDAIFRAKDYRLAVTVEEHNIMGGLGGIVAEVMTEAASMPRLLRLGINDVFNKAASYENLLLQNRLTPELIAADIIKTCC
ncbi:MAG: transketolase [Muribaculum sp.]|nr:transketolase [Muribaculaceae bacterium]MCM1080132.1 transketolase [Muribaculum sp.]